MAGRREEKDSFILKLEGVIEQHFEDPEFSLKRLCKEMNLSRSQLHRKTKAATGMSTTHFVRKFRLQKAAVLLRTTDLNISEIAYQTGINSPQNFSKYFQETFGLSPTDYRKSLSENKEKEVATAGPEEAVSLSKNKKLPLKILLGIGGLLVAGLLLYGLSKEQQSLSGGPVSEAATTSLAVIPFKNYSAGNDLFLAEGIVEDILTHLAAFEKLWVMSRTSTEKYRDTELSVPEIAAETGVRYILEGSVRQQDGQVRITVQLIDGKTDKHVWAGNYDRENEDILDLQSKVALDIARVLNQKISPSKAEQIQYTGTARVEAYRAVLRGRYLLRNRVRAEIELAIGHFDRAIAIDKGYSEAYASKAEAFHLLNNNYSDEAEAKSNAQQAEKYALLAIEQQADNAKAYAILGNVYREQFRFREAISSYEIALQHQPNDALINYWYALQLRSIGNLPKALDYHQKAADLDPLHPVISAGYIYSAIMTGDYQLANRILQEDTLAFPQSFLHYFVAGFNQMEQGQYAEAVRYYEKSLSINPDWSLVKNKLAICRGKMGDRAAVDVYLGNMDPSAYRDCLYRAALHFYLGSVDAAITYLKKAAAAGVFLNDFLADPNMAVYKTHPEIQALLEQFDLAEYADTFDNSSKPITTVAKELQQ